MTMFIHVLCSILRECQYVNHFLLLSPECVKKSCQFILSVTGPVNQLSLLSALVTPLRKVVAPFYGMARRIFLWSYSHTTCMTTGIAREKEHLWSDALSCHHRDWESVLGHLAHGPHPANHQVMAAPYPYTPKRNKFFFYHHDKARSS